MDPVEALKSNMLSDRHQKYTTFSDLVFEMRPTADRRCKWSARVHFKSRPEVVC